MTEHKLRIGCIDYLNSAPFYHGISKLGYELEYGTPADLMDAFDVGRIDVGLLPLGGLLKLEDNVRYIANLGIAAKQSAISVVLFANIPLENVKSVAIWITEQTVTSRLLLQILCDDWWHIADVNYVDSENECDAALFIGNAALKELKQKCYEYEYDLGLAWHKMTGLPFVFARWAINANVTNVLVDKFEQDLKSNFRNNMLDVNALTASLNKAGLDQHDAVQYLKNFAYELDHECLLGAAEFKKRIATKVLL